MASKNIVLGVFILVFAIASAVLIGISHTMSKQESKREKLEAMVNLVLSAVGYFIVFVLSIAVIALNPSQYNAVIGLTFAIIVILLLLFLLSALPKKQDELNETRYWVQVANTLLISLMILFSSGFLTHQTYASQSGLQIIMSEK
jgi:cell division protein FtsW (lipid II flippase)